MPQSPCLNRPQPAKEPLPQTTAWLQKGCNKANQKGPKIHSGPCIYPRHADKTFTCKLSNPHDCMKQILLDMDYVQSRESDQGLSPPWTSSKTDLKLHRLRQAYFEKQTISGKIVACGVRCPPLKTCGVDAGKGTSESYSSCICPAVLHIGTRREDRLKRSQRGDYPLSPASVM
ncbi:hypothetical protein F2P79_024514 [Pimephales promelas]|nr:hypothetical protein F2P79_024514 [Pimephales promelas]